MAFLLAGLFVGGCGSQPGVPPATEIADGSAAVGTKPEVVELTTTVAAMQTESGLAEPVTPAPEATPEPPPPTPSYGHADLDPDNDHIEGPPVPLDACEELLAAQNISFKPARIGVGKKRDGVYTCGAHQVVRFKKGPGKIKYSTNPLLTCQMALALADFERIAQEEAEAILHSRIKSIDHLGTYNCRSMAAYDFLSEHSFANGIDLRRFHLADGRTVDVLDDFEPKELSAPGPKSEFMRTLSRRLYDEEVFSVVVTPFFDRLHRNHIHVDLARYRADGTRP